MEGIAAMTVNCFSLLLTEALEGFAVVPLKVFVSLAPPAVAIGQEDFKARRKRIENNKRKIKKVKNNSNNNSKKRNKNKFKLRLSLDIKEHHLQTSIFNFSNFS